MANKLNKQGNSVGHDILMAISSVSNCTNVEIKVSFCPTLSEIPDKFGAVNQTLLITSQNFI